MRSNKATFKVTFSNRVRVALVTSSLVLALGGTAQVALAGPLAPPPGQASTKACAKKGKVGTKGCIAKRGPVAPPPGGI